MINDENSNQTLKQTCQYQSHRGDLLGEGLKELTCEGKVHVINKLQIGQGLQKQNCFYLLTLLLLKRQTN